MSLKTQYWLRFIKIILGKVPYIVLGVFVYPFIRRTETREKYYSGEGGWYNHQLWFMMNDDELKRYDVDWDIKKIGTAETRLGKFWKSYIFNPWRNCAYNYSLFHTPNIVDTKPIEILEDSLTKDGKKISPMWFAKWLWIMKDGSINNKGVSISYPDSLIGKSKVWFISNGILHYRQSYAIEYKVLFFWTIYESCKIGSFNSKYDIVYKLQGKFNKPLFKEWCNKLQIKFKNIYGLISTITRR